VSSQPTEDERAARIRQARQVLAGSDLRTPGHPLDFRPHDALLNPVQRVYLLSLGAILLVAAVLFVIWGLGVASPVLAILAFALLAGWVIF